MLVFVAIMGIGRFAYTPLLPRMQDAMGWSLAQAGDVAGVNFVGYLLGAIVGGPLAATRRRAGWLALALIGNVLTTFAGAVAWDWTGWLVVRFLAGITSALGVVLSLALVIDYVIRCGRPGLGPTAFTGVGIGIVLSVIAIEGTTRAGLDVFAQWAVLGAGSLVCVAVAFVIGRRLPNLVPDIATRRNGAPPERAPPITTTLRRLVASYGLLGFGYVITATFLVAMARGLPGSRVMEPLCWLVFGAMAAPSVPLGRWLADRHGVIRVMRMAFFIEAAGVLAAGMWRGAPGILIGGASLGGTFLAITALIVNAARAEAGPRGDVAIGWMTVSFGAGQLLGPFVAGRLAMASGGFAAPSALAAVALVLGALSLPLAPQSR